MDHSDAAPRLRAIVSLNFLRDASGYTIRENPNKRVAGSPA
jgi:hypothetical protein